MKRLVSQLFFLILSLPVFAFLFWQNVKTNSGPKLKTVKINNQKILVEVADVPEKQAQGLAGRTSLPRNQGMLFVFVRPGFYGFWMKETLIPLDFVWIANDRIVEITANVKPEDFQPPRVLFPQQEADRVLEINGGRASELGFELGDQVEF